MRSEIRESERRAPIVPADASQLITAGIELTVEESPHRAFPASAYEAAGCRIVPAGTWASSEPDQFIVGLKELPETDSPLIHRHIYFGHAYKGQHGSAELLRRFTAGGGMLLDLESLTDASGRRLAAFGFWAGYVGATLAVLHARGHLTVPLHAQSKQDLDTSLRRGGDDSLKVVVIGALGRCGRGAREALETAGITPLCWDLPETRELDRPVLLAQDILVNTVLAQAPMPPFLRPSDLDEQARQLSVVADVSCDVTSDSNPLPVYTETTSWTEPVRRLRDGDRPLDIIAIDNLPSVLPVEASTDFSAQLTPYLMSLGHAREEWLRCASAFRQACPGTDLEVSHV